LHVSARYQGFCERKLHLNLRGFESHLKA
jgi:hypothetical protein